MSSSAARWRRRCSMMRAGFATFRSMRKIVLPHCSPAPSTCCLAIRPGPCHARSSSSCASRAASGITFERNDLVDVRSRLGIPRGLNQLWSNGGILYAPPIR
jgi:hypothetical protein